MVVLKDPLQPLATPPRTPVGPATIPDPAPEPEARLTSFELESRGGYARTVLGRIAYHDREANTYVVRDRTGGLIRVPVRDITSSKDVDRRPRASAT